VEIDGNEAQTKIYLKKLGEMATYGDLQACRRKYLLNYFDEEAPDACGNCDVCLTHVEREDGTVLAQKVLSAVTRLDERFGAGYVIDFLRGSGTAKMQEHHKTIKTFGVGADVSKEAWSAIIRDMLAQGLISKTDGTYPVLKLTEKSDKVLRGTLAVMVTKTKEKLAVQEKKMDYEAALFRQLKDVRRQFAAAENVPAYIVLSDATLLELATYLPHTPEDFSKISGFGQVKIQKYGQPFGDAVVDYCRQHHLKSRIHLKSPKRPRRERPARDSDTKQQSLELFQQGHSIKTIGEVRGLSPATIEGHLAFYVQQGTIALDQIINPEKVRIIQRAIAETGGNTLTPIKESLGDDYSFGEIRLVMAHQSTPENGAHATAPGTKP
jgi:ATP-dependent DNA helicase RecQ